MIHSSEGNKPSAYGLVDRETLESEEKRANFEHGIDTEARKAQVQKEIDSVKQIMHENIERILRPQGGLPVLNMPDLTMSKLFRQDQLNSLITSGFTPVPNEIVVTRPLKELVSHIKHLQRPRLELIGRVIKTLALSLFRWHLCDQCLLKQGDIVTHSLTGRIAKTNHLQANYPYMLENAYILVLKKEIEIKNHQETFNDDLVSPDTIRDCFQRYYEIEITDKSQGNSIYDLFKSRYLDLQQSPA